MSQPWWEKLASMAIDAVTKASMRQSGATPAQMDNVVTASMVLPAFNTNPCPPVGVPESRDMTDCHPELQKRYAALKAAFEEQTGRQLFETCTWRSEEKQQQLYAQGRTAPGKIVTRIDGVLKKSRHNVYPAEAVDVCVDSDPGPGKHPVWNPEAYALLGPLAMEHGLHWGGNWTSFKDYPHLELPAEAA